MAKITLTVGNVSTCYEGTVDEVKEMYFFHTKPQKRAEEIYKRIQDEIWGMELLSEERKKEIKEEARKMYEKCLK